jgi:hypothetical protein
MGKVGVCRLAVCFTLISTFAALAPGRASASLVLDFSNTSDVLSGTTPSTNTTYLEVTFNYVSSSQVQAVFSVPNDNVSGLYVDTVGLMFNTSSAPTITHVSGVTASTSFNTKGIKVQGTGNEKFNTNFDFPNGEASRLKYGQSSTYDITFSSGFLNADLSNLLQMPDSSGNGYYAAAHLAGYGNSVGLAGDTSTGETLRDLGVTAVPEPASLVTVLTGLLPCGVIVLWRSRRLG